MFKNSKIVMSNLNKSKSIIIIDLENLTIEDKDFIKNNLPIIYDGRTTKKNAKNSAKFILNSLLNWSKEQQYGAISEFFLICILRQHEFTQEFCYKNLEENSVKKGFDGLYLDYNKNIWLAESKSSYTNIIHRDNLTKAYNDSKDKVEGKNKKRNVWENAYQHSRSANSSDSLQTKLNEMSEKYVNGIYAKIKNYKLIVSSTIYNDDINSVERSKEKIEEWLESHILKKELAVIITANSIDLIVNILKEIANE